MNLAMSEDAILTGLRQSDKLKLQTCNALFWRETMSCVRAERRIGVGVIVVLVSSMVLLGACGLFARKTKVMLPAEPPPKPASNEILVPLEKTNVVRPCGPRVTINALGAPSVEFVDPEKMMQGNFKVGGENVSFFVPM